MNQTGLSPELARPIHFGVFEVDLKAGELRKNGVKIKLREQPFQILSLLLERSGEVVTREELRHKLWSTDTFVDFDHSLNAAVKKLRDALGDSAGNPRFVETLVRRGYRFIAPVNQPFKDIEDKVTELAISTQADSSGSVLASAAGGRFRRLVVPSVVLAVCDRGSRKSPGTGLPTAKEKSKPLDASILWRSCLSPMPVAIPTHEYLPAMELPKASSIVISRLRHIADVDGSGTTVFRYKGKIELQMLQK